MTDMDMPLPEPDAYQYLFESYYGPVWRNDSRDWNGGKPIKTRTLHSADQLRTRDAKWRAIVAAEVAKERERAWYWCDFYAHAIDHGGNRYVRSNDALTAAHAVKSGTPAAAIRAGSAKS